MPITDLATNVILDNIGKVYFLKTGVYRDQVGLDNNHPLSSVSALLIHIEDGVPQNVMVANYAPSKMASWASHDFPLWYRGEVNYTIQGESAPRTFAQYFTYVPSILLAMNKNSVTDMTVQVTITQNTGANLLGGFADLTALNTEYPPTEKLSDDVATAYVYDSGTKGFYRVAWDGVSAWEWTLITQALVTYGVQSKQYNVLPIKVQRGYAPSQAPLSVSDEVIRLIYQEIAYINAVIANHTELIEGLDTDILNHLADFNNPHQVNADQVPFDNTGTDIVAIQTEEAIKEVNVKANTNVEDIDDLKAEKEDVANKAVAWGTPDDIKYPTTKLVDDRLDPIETFKDTTVPATYETIVNVDAKLLLKEDLINKVINFLVIDDVKYPSVQATETRIDSKVSAHNISGTAHADIRALISALQGAYVFRGFITVYAGTEPTPTELNNRITALLSRSPVVGDVLIDNSEIEWYFDGTNWNNMGQAIIALASAVNDGLMSKEDYAKLLALPTNATLTSLLDAKIAKTQIVNDLTTGGATDVLSAEQGKQLKIIADGLNGDIEALDVRVDTVELNVIDHEVRLDSVEGALRKQDSDVATVDDDGLGIVHLGKDVAETPVTVKVDGLILDSANRFNLVTGTVNGITYTVSGNQITLSGTASAETTLTLVTGLTATNKVYVNQDFISGTSTGVITLKNGATSLNAVYGTDYSGVVTLEGTTITLVIANGAVLTSLIYKFNINRVTVLISNKQYSPIYNTTFDLMSDANIKTQMDLWVQNKTLPNSIMAVDMDKRVKSVGKNIINAYDLSVVSGERYLELTGGTTASTASFRITNYIKVKPSTQYTISFTTSGGIRVLQYDYNKVWVIGNTASATSLTFTTSATTHYIRYSTDPNTLENQRSVQLEQGSTATTYEAYTNSVMYLQGNEQLNRLPNGVKDTIEYRNGKYYHVQRVQEYELVSGDITALITSDDDTDRANTIAFPLRVLDSVSSTNSFIPNWVRISTSAIDYIPANIGKYGFSANNASTLLTFIVAKGAYADLATAQSALAGTKILYQLATPIETEISVIGNAFAYPRGTFYIEDMVRRIGVYNAGITVDKPILTLNEIYRLNDDGSSTKLAVSGATVAGNGLSFTHSSLSNGDFVWFDYYYQGTNVKGLSTVYYYGDKMIVSGSGTTSGKVYKIVPTVVDENIVWTKVEV
jgi:hypothetical protein